MLSIVAVPEDVEGGGASVRTAKESDKLDAVSGEGWLRDVCVMDAWDGTREEGFVRDERFVGDDDVAGVTTLVEDSLV